MDQRIHLYKNQRWNIQSRASSRNGEDAGQGSSAVGNSASQKWRQGRQPTGESRIMGRSASNWAACVRNHVSTLREGVFEWDIVAFLCLAFAGFGGVTAALQGEVRDKGLEWGWLGIVKALRRPSKRFLISFTTHLPQLITSAAIALNWRGSQEKTQKSTEGE